MKITVTLDDDLLQTIRNAMYRSGRSFREVLNDALRTGLRETAPATKCTPFVIQAQPMGLQEGFEPAGLNK